MPRSRRNVRAALFAASIVCAAFMACSAFDLGDVVNAEDASSSDSSTDVSDAGAADAPFDGFGPCVPGGDPCACLDGAVFLATAEKDPGQALVIADGSAYFATKPMAGDALIYSFDIAEADGGAAVEIASGTPIDPSPMVAGSHYLFFRRTAVPIGISRLDENAPMPTVPTYFDPVDASVTGLVGNSQKIFFGIKGAGVCGIVFEDAGTPGPLDPCNGPPVVPPFQPGTASFVIAVDETTVFVMFNGKIYSAPISTGVATQIVQQSALNLSNLAENNGSLFWASGNTDAGALWTAKDDGSNVAPISRNAIEGSIDFPIFDVDDAGIYWSGQHYNKLWAARRDGTGPQLIACEDPASFIEAIVSAGRFIYWVDSIGGVWRVPKP